MSIKYCGIFSNNKDFTCLGENEDGKFKKFVLKHQAAIIKEPLSKKVELNMGFSLTFLKFDNDSKVICAVGNAKYQQTKAFTESVIDALTKFEIKLKDSQKNNLIRFDEYSNIINLKIDLNLVDINETMKLGSENVLGVNFQTTKFRKSVNLEQEKEEYIKEKKNVSFNEMAVSNSTISCNLKEGGYNNPENNNSIYGEQPDSLQKRKNTRLSKKSILEVQVSEVNTELTAASLTKDLITNKNNNQAQSRAHPTPTNKNKLIEIINNDVNELKTNTKKNIMEVIKNQGDLNELLIKSNNIKTNAFEYKENATELKKETRKSLLIWSLITGILVFIAVWVICSLVLCGNAFSPLCKI